MVNFDELFEKWENKYKVEAFIKDGIVDEGYYEDPHVLFVLRDMNYDKACDLREDLRIRGSGWKTWNNVGRWVKALLDNDKCYPADMSTEKRVEQLRRIAVMNLKKAGGSSRANGIDLELAVKTQYVEIMSEIQLCSPDIIICCGLSAAGITDNATLLKENVFAETSKWGGLKSLSFNREWQYYYTNIGNKTVPVVSFCHPQVTQLEGRRGHNDLFEPLYNDMLMIRNKFIV